MKDAKLADRWREVRNMKDEALVAHVRECYRRRDEHAEKAQLWGELLSIASQELQSRGGGELV